MDTNTLLQKLAEAAAAAGPQPAPAGGAPDPAAGMDPNDPMAAAPMDPVEQDNQKLTNILQNLELRSQIVEAQQALEAMTRPTSTRRSAKDPDKPRKRSRTKDIDISTASATTELLKNAPKNKRISERLPEKVTDNSQEIEKKPDSETTTDRAPAGDRS